MRGHLRAIVVVVAALLPASSVLAARAVPALVGSATAQRVEQAVGSPTRVAGSVCLARDTPAQLSTLFDTEPGGVIGADSQRATALPNGNVLWTFQDAEVRLPNGASTLVHNIGMMQVGTCFSVLMTGTAWDPRPWLFADATVQFSHWYWPLDAAMGTDGRVYVFAAEMYERGDKYLTRVEPTSTAIAGIDVDSWDVEYLGRPPNASDRLYGWSIASDERWDYLFANCYRQFGYDPFFDVLAHDRSCSTVVTVARVPRGQLFAAPSYWTGSRWSPRAADAAPIIARGTAHLSSGTDFVHRDNRWLAVTKIDDWFGREIYVETAGRPTGPFERLETIVAPVKCPQDCNTYHASWIPTSGAGALIIGLSNNRWDGILSTVYRPSYLSIAAPPFRFADADRCSIGHCS